ncbi:hypothetical protein H6P81_016073 [Aristolochia fimbriata]|uniref:Uncharacterized protein n=1 Tax=Aristolochia fimbriata TaxID=158543 RepID=A0AAV7E7Q9_ARIFI|nr:hypothetical protein H6P81_016073 [Aristolochia fimbriata]
MKIYQHQIQHKGHISWDGIFIRVPTNLLPTALVSLLQIRNHFLVHMVPKEKLSLFILETSLLDRTVTYHLLYHQRTSFTLEKQKTANTEENCSFLFLERKTEVGSKIMSNPFILTNEKTITVTRCMSCAETTNSDHSTEIKGYIYQTEHSDTTFRQSIQTEHSDKQQAIQIRIQTKKKAIQICSTDKQQSTQVASHITRARDDWQPATRKNYECKPL